MSLWCLCHIEILCFLFSQIFWICSFRMFIFRMPFNIKRLDLYSLKFLSQILHFWCFWLSLFSTPEPVYQSLLGATWWWNHGVILTLPSSSRKHWKGSLLYFHHQEGLWTPLHDGVELFLGTRGQERCSLCFLVSKNISSCCGGSFFPRRVSSLHCSCRCVYVTQCDQSWECVSVRQLKERELLLGSETSWGFLLF